jgi:hypothetical protein
MKACSYCGRENDDANAQCSECGTPFPSEESPWADDSYEFTEKQERIISGVASSMRIVGLVLLTLGGLQIAVAVVGGITGRMGSASVAAGVEGILGLVIGSFTMGAGTAFRRIVDTKGNDIGHLMEGFVALGSLYRVQIALLIIATILSCAALALALIGNGLTPINKRAAGDAGIALRFQREQLSRRRCAESFGIVKKGT